MRVNQRHQSLSYTTFSESDTLLWNCRPSEEWKLVADLEYSSLIVRSR